MWAGPVRPSYALGPSRLFATLLRCSLAVVIQCVRAAALPGAQKSKIASLHL
jgi:hypothetical protein